MGEVRDLVNISILGALLAFGLFAFASPANALLNPNFSQDKAIAQIDNEQLIDDNLSSDAALDTQMSLLANETRIYKSLNESSYTVVSTGNGWATINDSGRIAKIALVERVFVNSTDGSEYIIGRGLLRVSETGTYSLKAHAYNGGSVTFDIIDSEGDVQGTLILVERAAFSAFSIWAGSAELDDGQSYSVELAIMSRRSISADDISAGNEDETQKQGAWDRLRAFLRLN